LFGRPFRIIPPARPNGAYRKGLEVQIDQTLTVEFNVSGLAGCRPEVGVLVRVWGWDDASLDGACDRLSLVRALVAEGCHFGFSVREIEDFVLENVADFEDAELVRVAPFEFEITLVPGEEAAAARH
jgi:hypothetical protein